MSVEHERDINWSGAQFTLPNDTDVNGTPIEVYFMENMMQSGGHFAVWCEKETRGAPVAENLTKSQAKRRATKLQDKYGCPILGTVQYG